MSRSAAEPLGFLLALALLAGPAHAGGDGPVAALERIAAAVRARPVWTAAYVQEYVPAGMTAGETVSGTLTLAWPDRALFVEGDPPVRTMGMAGRKVRLVDLEAGSCDDHVLTESEWERIPLAALLDPEKALERFTVLTGDGALVLVPRQRTAIARVAVTAGKDGLPESVVVEDVSGAVNRFRFTEWRPGRAPRTGWLPSPPEGVTCLTDAG